jgi:hypothetical protein
MTVSSEDVDDGDKGLSDCVKVPLVETASAGGRVLSGLQDGNCASPAGPYWVAAAAGIRPKTLALMGRIRRSHGFHSILLLAILWLLPSRGAAGDVECTIW